MNTCEPLLAAFCQGAYTWLSSGAAGTFGALPRGGVTDRLAAGGRRQLIGFRSAAADLCPPRLSAARVAAGVGLAGAPIGCGNLPPGLG